MCEDWESYEIISIHAPVWGATTILFILSYVFTISIHAPVWGATTLHSYNKFSSSISIHAPVWGATLK